MQRIKGQGLKVLPTKTETSDLRSPLSPPCIKALKDHACYQQAGQERAGDAWCQTGYVFTTSFGTPLDPQQSPTASRPCATGPRSAASASTNHLSP